MHNMLSISHEPAHSYDCLLDTDSLATLDTVYVCHSEIFSCSVPEGCTVHTFVMSLSVWDANNLHDFSVKFGDEMRQVCQKDKFSNQ